jgi:hypothetical protein
MKTVEKRILQVSAMIADNLVEAMLDFRHGCSQQTNGLWDAMETLNPDIKRLDEQQRGILRNRNLSESLLNSLTVDQANAAYAVGILAGLHLAGRTDLILKFSAIYAKPTTESEVHFTQDGEMISTSH